MKPWIAVSLLLVACDLEPAGCDPTHESQVPAQAIGPAAAEFFIPAAAFAELGPAAARLLAQESESSLCVSLPPLQGSCGDLAYHMEAFNACRPLHSLSVTLQDSRLRVAAEYEATCLSRTIELMPGDPVKTCELSLSFPSARLSMTLAPATGAPRLELASEGRLEAGEPTISLSERCPLSGASALLDEVAGRLGPAQAEATHQAAAMLSDSLQRAAGISAGSRGFLAGPASDGRLDFSLLPALDGLALDEAGLHLVFSGGFFAAPSACMPANLPVAPPAASAPLWQFAPSSGDPFSLGVSLDAALVAQALGEALRAGLLCRPAGDGAAVPLDDLLPSVFGTFADAGGRAAFWPAGELALVLLPSRPDAPVRFLASFQRLQIDIYARLLGCEARVLALETDLGLELALVLEAGAPRLALRDINATRIEILHSALLQEGGGELRTRAAALLRRLAQTVLEELPPLPWQAPPIGNTGIASMELQQGRLTFFLGAYRP